MPCVFSAPRELLGAMGDALMPSSDGGRVATSVAAGPVPGAPTLTAWAQAAGRFDSVAGDGNAHGFNASAGGGTGGIETAFPGDITAGAALGYAHSNFSLSGLSQSGSFDQVALGACGEERWGIWFLDGAGALGYDHLDGTRQIGFLGRTAKGSLDGFARGLLVRTRC
jgi:uncharacterized protein with beta-barrel porin domain